MLLTSTPVSIRSAIIVVQSLLVRIIQIMISKRRLSISVNRIMHINSSGGYRWLTCSLHWHCRIMVINITIMNTHNSYLDFRMWYNFLKHTFQFMIQILMSTMTSNYLLCNKLNKRHANLACTATPIVDWRTVLEATDANVSNYLDHNPGEYAYLLLHISMISRTDKPTYEWIFCIKWSLPSWRHASTNRTCLAICTAVITAGREQEKTHPAYEPSTIIAYAALPITVDAKALQVRNKGQSSSPSSWHVSFQGQRHILEDRDESATRARTNPGVLYSQLENARIRDHWKQRVRLIATYWLWIFMEIWKCFYQMPTWITLLLLLFPHLLSFQISANIYMSRKVLADAFPWLYAYPLVSYCRSKIMIRLSIDTAVIFYAWSL